MNASEEKGHIRFMCWFTAWLEEYIYIYREREVQFFIINTNSILNYNSFDFLHQVWPLVLFKNLCKILLLLLWFALLTKVLQEWLKFDYIYTSFLNKTNGQTWVKKVKRIIIRNGGSITETSLWSLESWLGQASKQVFGCSSHAWYRWSKSNLGLSWALQAAASRDRRSAELDRFRRSPRRRGSEEYVAPCMQVRRRRPPHARFWWLVQVHCTNAGDLSPCSSNPSHCKRRFICPSRLKYSN
jgi:hypothetical protein